jgi:hypothetical protein
VNHPRSNRLAELVQLVGADLSAPDPEKRRLDRLERVQAAWLRDLSAARRMVEPPDERAGERRH